MTNALCVAVREEFRSSGRHIPLVLSSSTQAALNTAYGKSKLEAERAVQSLSSNTGNPCIIFRFPGVFGKWCKPNYNSVVATFCYNIARNLPIQIDDPEINLRLVYVDDVVTAILDSLENQRNACIRGDLKIEYTISLGELATKLYAFADLSKTLMVDQVYRFMRALYATYISYLPNKNFLILSKS